MRRSPALAAVAFAVLAVAVRAADAPNGYGGKGQVVITTTIGGSTTLSLGGNIEMEERGTQLRVDIVSLAIPGADPTISALLGTQLFPPGGFTIVYDRSTNSYTVWSSSRQRFYSSAPATRVANARRDEASTAGSGGDLFGIFSFAKSLRDDGALNVTLGLAGHGTVNGHPASGLNFSYSRTTNGGDSTEVHGTLQFADDLDGVPVQVFVAGKGKSLPQSSLKLDFTSLHAQSSPDSDFTPPQGYTRSTSLGDVIGKALPIPGT